MGRRQSPKHKAARGKSQAPGEVRIIGGEHRSRRIPVVQVDGLRPTGDRARETLFNWLGQKVLGASVLDLFAGTGALGFEAASRGAGRVTMIESNTLALEGLRSAGQLLRLENIILVNADALQWSNEYADANPGETFDIVFVDPPFDANLHQPAIDALSEDALLKPGCLVYIESQREQSYLVPSHWEEQKDKVQGNVRLRLFRNSG